jgi:hypothetical protein
MSNNNLSSYDDLQRLIKKIDKLKNQAWLEMNSISGIDPKFRNRQKIYLSLDKLHNELSK